MRRASSRIDARDSGVERARSCSSCRRTLSRAPPPSPRGGAAAAGGARSSGSGCARGSGTTTRSSRRAAQRGSRAPRPRRPPRALARAPAERRVRAEAARAAVVASAVRRHRRLELVLARALRGIRLRRCCSCHRSVPCASEICRLISCRTHSGSPACPCCSHHHRSTPDMPGGVRFSTCASAKAPCGPRAASSATKPEAADRRRKSAIDAVRRRRAQLCGVVDLRTSWERGRRRARAVSSLHGTPRRPDGLNCRARHTLSSSPCDSGRYHGRAAGAEKQS